MESDFPKTTFRKTNIVIPENQTKFFFYWNWPESVFRWPEIVFRWPESIFYRPTFLMTNKHRKILKIIFKKLFSKKQMAWGEFTEHIQTSARQSTTLYIWTHKSKTSLVVGGRQLKIAVQHSIFNHFLTPTYGIFK